MTCSNSRIRDIQKKETDRTSAIESRSLCIPHNSFRMIDDSQTFLFTLFVVCCSVLLIGLSIGVTSERFLLIYLVGCFSLYLFLYGFFVELESASERARVSHEMALQSVPPVDCGMLSKTSDELPTWKRIGFLIRDTRQKDCAEYIERITRAPKAQPAEVFVDYVCKLWLVVVDRMFSFVSHHDFVTQIALFVFLSYTLVSLFQTYLHAKSERHMPVILYDSHQEYIKTINQC